MQSMYARLHLCSTAKSCQSARQSLCLTQCQFIVARQSLGVKRYTCSKNPPRQNLTKFANQGKQMYLPASSRCFIRTNGQLRNRSTDIQRVQYARYREAERSFMSSSSRIPTGCGVLLSRLLSSPETGCQKPHFERKEAGSKCSFG